MRVLFVIAIVSAVVCAGGADQAAALLKKGEVKRAAEAARKATAKDPTNVDAWLVLADALVAQGEPADAWEAVEKGMAKNPKDARLDLKLGDVFIKMAEQEQRGSNDGTTITNYYLDAERMFAEAEKKNPKLADAVFGQAFVNFSLNRRDKARALIKKCLGLKQDHAKCLALQAYDFYLQNKYPEAQRIYEIALKLDDSSVTDMVRYGHTFFAQGKKDEAKQAYIAALKRHPGDTTPILSGLRHLAGKKWEPLTPFLREAVKAAPKSNAAWFYLGYCETVGGRNPEALAAFERALKIEPDNAQYLYYVGYCKEKAGDARAALDHYRKSLKKAPNYADPRNRFQMIAVGMRNDIDTMEKLFDELLTLAPDAGWVRNDYALLLRNWCEARGAAQQKNPPANVVRRLKRSQAVYEEAAKLLPKEAQVQSDCGLLFEFYPSVRDDKKAERYFSEALVISEWTYRDAWSGIRRLATRTKNWELLKDHAEGMIGALEGRGLYVVAPVGGGAPKELKNQTPMILEQAKAALSVAERHLGSKGKG